MRRILLLLHGYSAPACEGRSACAKSWRSCATGTRPGCDKEAGGVDTGASPGLPIQWQGYLASVDGEFALSSSHQACKACVAWGIEE